MPAKKTITTRENRIPDPLRAFSQHGVRFTNKGDVNRLGNCPFCGKADHFSVNEKTKQWRCLRGGTKVCAKGGGFATFLKEIHLRAVSDFTDGYAQAIAEDRGIAVETFRRAGFGYNIAADTYTIPIPDSGDTGHLQDLRYYRLGKRVMSTASCSLGLYRWEGAAGHDILWLCEGEWDTLAMDEMLYSQGIAGEYAVGVPGAGILKADWISIFRDKTVFIAYDNDDPGRVGALKSYEALKDIAFVQCVIWPETAPVGYDIRDMYVESQHKAELTYKKLKTYLKSHPPGYDEAAPINIELKRGVELTGQRIEATEVYERYRKWLHLPDITMLDVLYGTIIANRIPGDPLWLFLIGVPGATKTEPLISLRGCPKITTVTTLNQYALISGARTESGVDPSLIPQLDGRVLIIQDFTTILQMQPQKRDEIFGTLRAAFDGHSEKAFGRGMRSYKSTFGIIAAVTPAIEQYAEACSALGERFLGYTIPLPKSLKERRLYLQKARQNTGKEVLMKKELGELSLAILTHPYNDSPKIPESINEKLDSAAQFTSMMRGTVSRDRYTRQVTQRPYSELGTRLVKQLTKAVIGIAKFRGHTARVLPVDYAAVRDIARGTIPSLARGFIDTMYKNGSEKEWTSKEISEEVKISAWPTGECIMENLSMLGVLEKGTSTMGKKSYRINEEIVELIETGEMIK